MIFTKVGKNTHPYNKKGRKYLFRPFQDAVFSLRKRQRFTILLSMTPEPEVNTRTRYTPRERPETGTSA